MEPPPSGTPTSPDKNANDDPTSKKPGEARPCCVCKTVHVACDRARPCGRCKRLGKDAMCQDPPAQRRGRRPHKAYGEAPNSSSTFSYSYFRWELPKIRNAKDQQQQDPQAASLPSLNGIGQFASSAPANSRSHSKPSNKKRNRSVNTNQFSIYNGPPSASYAHAPPLVVYPPLQQSIQLPSAIQVNFDVNGNVGSATREFAQLLGYSMEELLGLNMNLLFTPEHIDAYRSIFSRMVNTGPINNDGSVQQVLDISWLSKQKERLMLPCRYAIFVKDKKMLSHNVVILPSTPTTAAMNRVPVVPVQVPAPPLTPSSEHQFSIHQFHRSQQNSNNIPQHSPPLPQLYSDTNTNSNHAFFDAPTSPTAALHAILMKADLKAPSLPDAATSLPSQQYHRQQQHAHHQHHISSLEDSLTPPQAAQHWGNDSDSPD